jgi:diacylglycerol kinase family enzyme
MSFYPTYAQELPSLPIIRSNRMKAKVVLNRAAGLRPGQVQAEAAAIADLFAQAGVLAEVKQVQGQELPEAAREASRSDADVVVMGGGDGTMSAGAGALAGTGKAMGVLPLGTLNHFARDLGVPMDLGDAVRTVATGVAHAIDVGEANGRVFVNNSSIGIYPAVVSLRDAWMDGRGMHKWVAMGRAGLIALRHFPVMRVTLRMREGGVRLNAPIVFIGNNRYQTRLFALGKRERLDQGELWVYLARDAGRWGLLRLGLRAMVGKLDDSRDFEGLGLTELRVEDRRGVIDVAFDGEVCELEPPVEYRIRPKALTVMVPRAEG